MADIKITSAPAPTATPVTVKPAAPATVTLKPAAPSAPATLKPAAPAAPTFAPAKPVAVIPVPLIPTLTTQSGMPISAQSGASTQKPAANSFQNIFTKTTQEAAAPKMIDSIVAGKGTSANKLKPILGSAPQLQKTLEQEKEYRQKKALKNWQIIFAMVLVLGLGSAGYFYSQLSPTFTLLGQNVTAELGLVNGNLVSVQTSINKYRYMMAQTTLNSFSYVAEQYLDTSEKLTDANLTPSAKALLSAKLNEQENQIVPILTNLRTYLLPDLVYKTVTPEGQLVLTDEEILVQYQDALRAALEEEKATLLASATAASKENQDAVRLIDNTLKLVGNNSLIGSVKGLQLADLQKSLDDFKASNDPVIRKQIQTVFRTLLSSTSSDIAVIASLKAERINWSTLMKQIADETKKIDPNFDTDIFRNELIDVTGGINYDSLEFDADSNKISVTGTTLTTDGTNFTTISDLIDGFEASPYFKDVEMRSFSKSGDDEMGYSSNFNFALGLETPEEAQNGTTTVSLGRDNLKARTGIKRIKN